MDFLMTILVFGAMAFLSGNRNKKIAEARKQAQRQQAQKRADKIGNQTQVQTSSETKVAKRPVIEKPKTQRRQESGQVIRDLAKHFGLEEVLDMATQKRGQPLADADEARTKGDQVKKKQVAKIVPKSDKRLDAKTELQKGKNAYLMSKEESKPTNKVAVKQLVSSEPLVALSSERSLFADRILWSQVLGEPRCRKPYFPMPTVKPPIK